MHQRAKRLLLLLTLAAPLAACGGTPSDGDVVSPLGRGQTDFTSQQPRESGARAESGDSDFRARNGMGGSATAAPGAAPQDRPPVAAPGGRVAEVEEADIYRVDGNRLFYLNTYRGLVVYDLADPANPKRVSRLPVFGYPIEMFVEGNTVYALLKDALYLSQANGRLQFERHNVSQLVAIDVSDLANPKVLRTIDIKGQLREGVARKVENSIYVVSQIHNGYWWGWGYDRGNAPQKQQAWVYSFDVTDRQNPRKVGELQIFEGGSVNLHDPKTGTSLNRSFGGVALSATANALMVVENWHVSAYSAGDRQQGGCGSHESTQQAVVSIIDISRPDGTIRRHTRFETQGQLNDQFKMTYVHDEATKTGTFYGIFGRQVWAGANCTGNFYTQNTMESWDVTDGDKPVRLATRNFGKPNETVRGSAFDVDRKVAYAITAQRIDPLYAISFADRTKLEILSEIDGLSGDMTVFRLIGGGKFLLAVGQDNSGECSGFQDGNEWRPTRMAVSIIDVQDLRRIRLVQRRCVSVKNADWISSAVSNDLDQAHKMIGMHSDGHANVITVPIHYSRRSDDGDWWWYRWETAVGMMAWDLAKYDPQKNERQQTVLENYGTVIHPHGEVRRSIVFTHQGASPRRMMINLSDTHISLVDIEDLRAPKAQSVIELAPYYNQVYRFGDYVVEQLQSKPNHGWLARDASDLTEFRVKRAGGDLEAQPVVATFTVGQVSRVLKHGDKLVLFRQVQPMKDARLAGEYVSPETVALVYDLSDPRNPRRGGTARLPNETMPYYRFFCGGGGYWGGYWFDQGSNFTETDGGLVFLVHEWKHDPRTDRSTVTLKLVTLETRNAMAPRAFETVIGQGTEWDQRSLVPDGVDPKGFFLTRQARVGTVQVGNATLERYRHFAQRFALEGGKWVAKEEINLPGPLVRTWRSGNERRFLTQDQSYRHVQEDGRTSWRWDWRLALLRATSVAGRPAAELLDARTFTDMYLGGLVLDGDRLIVNGRPNINHYWGFGGGDVAIGRPAIAGGTTGSTSSDSAPSPGWQQTSDRLMIFDLSAGQLTSRYDQPTKAYDLQLMGTHKGKLFLNLSGDGVVVIDVSNPAQPQGVRFLRTLGWASHIEFAGDDVYVSAGHFGIFHMSLAAPPQLPIE